MAKAKIAVAVRVRPLLQQELHSGHTTEKLIIDQEKKEILFFNEKFRQYKGFRFDKVFGMGAPQEDIYSEMEVPTLLSKVVEGYHATIFAYGQTGSGKTYSMEGYRYEMMDEKSGKPFLDDEGNKGVIPRAVESLFQKIKEAQATNKRKYQVYCSYLQIYQEKIYDLLNNFQYSTKGFQSQNLKLRWNKQDDFIVENLYTFECKSPSQIMELFHIGIRNKVLASHRLNNASSRSHTILTVTVESFDPNNPHSIITSKLHLVDLAGSERTGQTGAQGRVQKESIDINKSLFTLRSVIVSLAERQSDFPSSSKSNPTYVPYRDSKLTSILRQSLGGNSYCLMLACVAPSDDFFQENISTLTYATKAAYIANSPIKNEDPKLKLIRQLKQQIQTMQREMESANQYIQFLCTLTGETVKTFGRGDAVSEAGTQPLPKKKHSLPLAGHQLALTMGQQFQFKRGNSTVTPKEVRQSAGLPSPMNQTFQKNQHIGSDRPETSTSINIFMPNGTQSNFMTNSTFVTQKSKGLQTMAKSIAKQPNFITERLIESVQMVKEVLQSNIVLRENIANLTGEVDRLTSQLFELQCENDDVRDKMQILESLAGRTAPLSHYDVDSRSKKDIANELLRIKKEKRALELRVRHMELDRIRQQQQQQSQQQYQAYRTLQHCPSDEIEEDEPVRPAMMDRTEARPLRPLKRIVSQKSKNMLNHTHSVPKRESNQNSKSEFEGSLNNIRLVNTRVPLNLPDPIPKREFPRKQVAEAYDRFQSTFGANALDTVKNKFRRTTGLIDRNIKLTNRQALPELDRQHHSEVYADGEGNSEREAIIAQMNKSFTEMENEELPQSMKHASLINRDPYQVTPQPRQKSHSVKQSKVPSAARFGDRVQSTRSNYQRLQTTTIPMTSYGAEMEDYLPSTAGKSIKRKLKTSNMVHKSLPNSIQEELDKPITPPSLPVIDER